MLRKLHGRGVRCTIVGLGAGLAAVVLPAGAGAVGGQQLLVDDFSGATTNAPLVSLNTNTAGFPCLTAGADPSATPVAGCALASPDPIGSGVLRLTDARNSEASAVLYNTSFPTREGLDITFDQYQYGGSGADGISFDLAVAPPQPTALGPAGGSLGYGHNPNGADVPGLPGGYLGIGLDAFGNYANTDYDGTGCTDPSWAHSGLSPNEVTVRGPGDVLAGYCLLSSSLALSPDPLNAFSLRAGSRAASLRAVRVTIDPATQSYSVGIDPTGGTDYAPVASGPLPSSYFDPTTGSQVNGIPARLTFAFAASTGGLTDVHEVSTVKATTLNGAVPVLTLSKTDDSGGTVSAGGTLTYKLLAGVASSSPAAENDPSSMRIADPLPPGETLASAPGGTGWDCSASTSTLVNCVNTSTAPLSAGASLPPISVPVTVAASAPGSVTNTAQLLSSDAAAPVAGSDTVSVTHVSYSGRAFVSSVSLFSSKPTTFLDTGDILTPAATSTEKTGAKLPGPGLSGEVLSASVVTGNGLSTAHATISELAVGGLPLPAIKLTAVRAASQSTCAGASGTTTIAHLAIGGKTVIDAPTSVAPNRTIALGSGARLVLNQQLPVPGASHGLEVNAIHLIVPGIGDIVLGSARSDIHGC